MRRGIPIALGLLAAGCGGQGPEPVSVEDTAGPTDTAGGEALPEPAMVLRTTIPVPVPQPPVPRERLSGDLQRLWDRTERVVEVRPPEPPAEGTVEAVQAWAGGPFLDWMRARRAVIAEAENDVAFLSAADPPERAVAATLFGYMYEDTAAGMRGAPVPEDIAADPDLLEVYVETLGTALLPYAVSSAEAYATCATTLDAHGDRAWAEWLAYCADRARELVDVYRLQVPQ